MVQSLTTQMIKYRKWALMAVPNSIWIFSKVPTIPILAIVIPVPLIQRLELHYHRHRNSHWPPQQHHRPHHKHRLQHQPIFHVASVCLWIENQERKIKYSEKKTHFNRFNTLLFELIVCSRAISFQIRCPFYLLVVRSHDQYFGAIYGLETVKLAFITFMSIYQISWCFRYKNIKWISNSLCAHLYLKLGCTDLTSAMNFLLTSTNCIATQRTSCSQWYQYARMFG